MSKKYLYIIIAVLGIVILSLLTYKTSEKIDFKGIKTIQRMTLGFWIRVKSLYTDILLNISIQNMIV